MRDATMSESCNVWIAGCGGQGVIALFRVLVALADATGVAATGTAHRGGAQTQGTVGAELRLDTAAHGAGPHGATIPPGRLDLLLGLDPTEALRVVGQLGLPRRAVIDDHEAPPLIDELGLDTALWPCRAVAVRHFGTPAMANLVAGLAALPLLPAPMRDPARFAALFFELVPGAAEHAARAGALLRPEPHHATRLDQHRQDRQPLAR